MNQTFWKGKRVLITGHTGFKGSWLTIWLCELGAEVIGYGLAPYTERDNYVICNLSHKITDIRGDIRDLSHLQQVFEMYQPEIIFHMAAQSLVRRSYREPILTYETNVMGTVHVLECIRKTDSVRAAVMITTDKCYENKETMTPYVETDSFGGYDPYSASKACDEIIISSYRNSYMNPKDYEVHHKAVASVRAGNVIGGGDWSEDRLIPDCVRSIESGQTIKIRSPKALRPWQFVLEPLYGYLRLAEKLYEEPTTYCEGWNFGPRKNLVVDVWTIAQEIVSLCKDAKVEDCSNYENPHEAGLLLLDSTKAKERLGWSTKLTIADTLRMTFDWYRNYEENEMYSFCVKQIEEYTLS